MENQMYLFPNESGTWMVEHLGPHSARVADLFGTAIIPTPYSLPMAGREVLARLQAIPANNGVYMDYFESLEDWRKEVGL